MNTTRITIVIDGIPEEKLKKAQEEFQQKIFLKVPNDYTFHFDVASEAERQWLYTIMAAANALYAAKILRKQTGGN